MFGRMQQAIVRPWGVFCLTAVLASAAVAQTAEPQQAHVISKQWHADYEVASDGRSTMTYASANQVLHASALEDAKSLSFSYSTSIQKGEILEAYTLKADGRRIAVPATNYQTEVNNGRDGAKPLFSDYTRLSVVFPDVAVGDTVGVKYRVADKEPIFPGAFSVVQSFSPATVYEDARITVRFAKPLALKFESHNLQEEAAREDNGLQVREWRYRNPVPRTYDEADEGIWRLEEFPVLMVSTFPSYESIAKAYGDRALPKAEPTARVTTLAKSIVGDQTDPLTRARLLYEWVSRNITYGGNCIGVGAVVPRDTDTVLDNKMGDCKDHATLLQALWRAAGIRGEQVLINAGNQLDLPATPVVSMVNHVINYLPDWKIYLDATAKEIPFGYLPDGSYGKPVLHVGAATTLATIPPSAPDRTQQHVRTRLRIGADGSATGDIQISLKGTRAAQMRTYMRDLKAATVRDFVRRTLSGSGFKAKGELDRGDLSEAKALSDEYAFGFTFEIDNYLQAGTSGAFRLAPVVNLPLSVAGFAFKGEQAPVTRRHYCEGFKIDESYDIELAPGVSFAQLPESLTKRGRYLEFASSYKRTKNGVRVVRELFDKTPDGVCTADFMNAWQAEVEPIAQNLKSQVFYKRKSR
ncbi:Transglutaminase-like superfamily protein [compost metagenome]